MNKLVVLPYKMNSLSSRAISRHFGCKRVYPDRNYRPKSGDTVINWGFCGIAPVLDREDVDFTILNKPDAVNKASDKISTLRLLKQNNVPHVEFLTNKACAKAVVAAGQTVYCRTLTRGKEGKGIVLAMTPEDVVDARLYTRHFKNDKEFRIHVFNGEVIDMVEKRKMSTERMLEMGITRDESSKYIRNMKKGYSFCRKDLVIPEHVQQIAIDATKALGLDFSGVDIAYNSETDEAKVLELNTACGFGTVKHRGDNFTITGIGTTHLRYVRAISKYLDKPFSLEEYNSRYNCNAEIYLR